MQGHKIAGEGPNHIEIQHPDGSRFKIAKAGLTTAMLATIAKMPKVEHKADGGDSDIGTSEMPDPTQLIPDAVSNAAGSAWDAMNKPTFMSSNSSSPSIDATASSQPEWPANQQAGSYDPTAVTPANTDSPTPDGQPAPTPDKPTNSPQPVQSAPQGASSPDYLSQYLDSSKKIAQGQINAETAKGQAESEGATATAGLYDQQAKDLQANQDQFNKNFASRMAQNDQLSQDIANTKIDPQHFWSSASTAGKIGMLAGMIISGAGANAGQGNAAMNIINKNVENDIDAQKANLQNKHSLLRNNL